MDNDFNSYNIYDEAAIVLKNIGTIENYKIYLENNNMIIQSESQTGTSKIYFNTLDLLGLYLTHKLLYDECVKCTIILDDNIISVSGQARAMFTNAGAILFIRDEISGSVFDNNLYNKVEELILDRYKDIF